MTDILDGLLSELDDLKTDITDIRALTLDDLDVHDSPHELLDHDRIRPKKKFLCPRCEKKLIYIHDQGRRKCVSCAYSSKIISGEMGDSMNGYNNISGSSVVMRVQGSGLMKSSISRQVLQSSDTKKYRQSKILESVVRTLSNSSLSIPKVFLEEAVEKYCHISQLSSVRLVFRGDGLKSMLAGFISFVCLDNDLNVSNQSLASAFSIAEKAITKARRIIYSLNERGLTNVVNNNKKLDLYIKASCASLKIPEEYCPFLVALIKKAEQKNLHLLESTVEKTRCAGAICMLISCVKVLHQRISLEKIQRKCKVTIPTFMKYYKLLLAHKLALRNVFKQYKIPKPLRWKTEE